MDKRTRVVVGSALALACAFACGVESGGFNHFRGIRLTDGSGSAPLSYSTTNSRIDVGASARIKAGTSGIVGLVSDSSTATGYVEWRIPDGTRLALLGNSSTDLTLTLANAANLIISGGVLAQATQTHQVADNGGGTAPASTITPTGNVVLLDYDDATAASVGTLSETGAEAGAVVMVCHVGSGGTVVFTEVAGQQEVGGTACTLALSDCLEAVYVNSSWHFLSCRDN